jgi:hypothetical protein
MDAFDEAFQEDTFEVLAIKPEPKNIVRSSYRQPPVRVAGKQPYPSSG